MQDMSKQINEMSLIMEEGVVSEQKMKEMQGQMMRMQQSMTEMEGGK
jgi:hypothetical protein